MTDLTWWEKYNPTIRLVYWQTSMSLCENGIMVGILPYVLKPYPHGDALLTAAVMGALIVDPIMCYLAYRIPTYHARGITCPHAFAS